jgi:hypothetical protein
MSRRVQFSMGVQKTHMEYIRGLWEVLSTGSTGKCCYRGWWERKRDHRSLGGIVSANDAQ